jgi:hypothetical protein
MFRKYEKTFRIQVPQYSEIGGKHYFDPKSATDLFQSELVVTEKLDGANIGIIGTKKGFRLQKRGSLVDTSEHDQFNFFKAWSSQHYMQLTEIPTGWILYGELLRCVHTVHYNRLPDWVVFFALWDGNQYQSYRELCHFTSSLGLHVVPLIAEGHFERETIVDEWMPKVSAYGDEEAEGIVLFSMTRQIRGKIVKPAFLKRFNNNGDEHWTHNPIRYNKVVSATDPAIG